MSGDDVDMALHELSGLLEEPVMKAMGFLNEISMRYPDAISFAAGRPVEDFLEIEGVHRHLDIFVDYLREELSLSDDEVRRTVLQYGRTKGIIHTLIGRYLATDEGIHVPDESIVTTVGCQEALYLVLRVLRRDDRDVVLAVSPTYVGLAGAAQLVDMPVWPVDGGPEGVDVAAIVRQASEARRRGLGPRALYLITDAANPTGLSLSLPTRRRLLEVAEAEDLLLIEDDAYGVFAGEERLPSLKALDRARTVVRVGSFAKNVLPGARVGYVVADQRVGSTGDGGTALLADHLATVKSMLTVNTSPVAQAVVGGALLESRSSLQARNRREIEHYRRNLAAVLGGLSRRFRPGSGVRGGVTWNQPAGGFFLTITVPFPVDDALLVWSAERFGVLWTPMSHFYIGGGGHHQIRLSFSQLSVAQIDRGLDRLSAMIDACG